MNDSLLLESHIYSILRRHFKNEIYYSELIELFRETTLQTELGQLLDLTSIPKSSTTIDNNNNNSSNKINLNLFTPSRQVIVS